MIQINSVNDLRNKINQLKNVGNKIGFVPTMGALHEGHLSLISAAKRSCDFVICSIFINPTQFNNPKDYASYPINIEKDIQMLEGAGCDLLFLPDKKTMYPENNLIHVEVKKMTDHLEGKFRPGHFSGVLLIIAKLLNIILPDVLILGRKDLQQVKIISRLINDLFFPVQIEVVETKREEDGLAMSSRNLLLSPEQRKIAPILFQVLSESKSLLKENSIKKVRDRVETELNIPGVRLEYFEIIDENTFMPLDEIKGESDISVCISAYIGNVRLIDNISLNS